MHGQEACEEFAQIRADVAQDSQEGSAGARHHLPGHRRSSIQAGHAEQHN